MRRIFLISLLFLHKALLFGQGDAEKVFSQIYQQGAWGKDHLGQGTSGPGSTLKEGRPFIKYVQDFLRSFDVRSIVDLGCGDWALAREIDWSHRNYLGIDVVPSVIAKNQALYASDNIKFLHLDGSVEALPSADLLICKDVLQHLPLSKIFQILFQIQKFKYVIFVNGFSQGDLAVNGDIPIGSYRPLDLSKPPFNLTAQDKSNYLSGQEIKQIFLIVNPNIL